MSAPIQWTAALVHRAMRKAYAAQPRQGQPPGPFAFIAERAGEVLGRQSPEFVALALRAASPAGALSLREMCRERIGWHGTRSELYRRSNNGAVRVAAALTADGTPIPEALGGQRQALGTKSRRRTNR
jgi:hypothetical protein